MHPSHSQDMSRATGVAEEEDFGSRLKRVMQLTGLSDPVYAEAVVTVHEYDIVLDVLLINQTNESLSNVCLELATVGDLKLCERPQNYAMAPHANINIRANIKVGIRPKISETGTCRAVRQGSVLCFSFMYRSAQCSPVGHTPAKCRSLRPWYISSVR